MDEFTLDSDAEIAQEHDYDSNNKKDTHLNNKFSFDDGESIRVSTIVKKKKKEPAKDLHSAPDADDNVRLMPHVEERLLREEKKSKKRKQQKGSVEEEEDEEDTESELDEEQENEQREAEYYDEVLTANEHDSNKFHSDELFTQLNLSRPLLRAIEMCGYTNPTPIQSKVIPIAMSGRDVCASAVTGSGKTAAFLLPILERLLYRSKSTAAIRVLVVTPTRELATQIYEVLEKLSALTDVTSCLICGGKKDLRSQEAQLRQRPDIVVCTPGRIIDHLRNSMSISLADLDVLVLDEVDRLLDLGFQEELEELVKYCPTNRQTLLFSATMTTKVEDLIKLSLQKPVRVKITNSTTAVAPRLIQEFVKLRNVDEREAYLAALIVRHFHERTICFFETKVEAHRFYALLRLMGMSVAELHGNLTQVKRYAALQDFKEGKVEVLLATDVAARGLDIPGVLTVINSEMPRNTSQYIHRVGRTARAGCGGRSITLVTDARRKMMKEILKSHEMKQAMESTVSPSSSPPQILTRTIPAAVIHHFIEQISGLESNVQQLLAEEKAQEKMELAQREIESAENRLRYEEEIMSRPARTWYMTEKEKTAVKQQSKDHALGLTETSAAETHESLPKKERRALPPKKDEYLMDEKERSKEINHGKHSMSRVKRRRLEARKAMEEADEATEKSNMNGTSAKAELKLKEEKKHEKELKSLSEKSMNSKSARTKTGKVVRPTFATGGLDADMREWGMLEGYGGGSEASAKRKTREQRELEEFKPFDPNKRLGKKLGRKQFKSKARFKRRK